MNIDLIKTITVLYVEDEASLREDVRHNITPFVKEVIVASDGMEGFELFMKHKNHLDVIITDILMPRMNGLDMVDKIREIDSEIPIIYTTAFNDSDYMKRTIEQSVITYIVKPIDIELLLKGIEKASLKIENERLKASLLEINQHLKEKVREKTKEIQEKNITLYKQLHTDELTSLLNRKSLREDILETQNPVLALIDIDSFRTVNELYGEKVGNEILINIAAKLNDFSKSIGCKCYRIDGDIFALLGDCSDDTQQACFNKIKSLIEIIAHHSIQLSSYDISINVSITIGIVSKEKTDIIEKASMALKKAKQTNTAYLVYSEEYNFNKEYQNDIKWSDIIKKAIEDEKVVMFYQPIVDKNRSIIKYESLVRIVEEEKIYPPSLFLDIAKKVKLYSQLTKSILTNSFHTALQNNCRVNINLSIQDIENREIINTIEELLLKNNIGHLITFEILESESIKDYEKVISFIKIVKNLGCTIAIDDFGSGYSNFEYLLRLKPDFIKIDGSLVKNIDKDNNALLITKTINSFAHSLGIKTVAEFVHSQEVFKLLQDMGIDQYQGFYFSEPKEEIIKDIQ